MMVFLYKNQDKTQKDHPDYIVYRIGNEKVGRAFKNKTKQGVPFIKVFIDTNPQG